MARATDFRVRIDSDLGDFIETRIGRDGPFRNAEDYVRALIRRDMAADNPFDRLKDELKTAFDAPDDSYVAISANDIVGRSDP